MAQLRDIQTSECIFTGDLSDALVLADAVGFDQVLFDDVGKDFDPEAAWADHEARVAALETASKSRAETATKESRAAAKDELESLAVDADVGDPATVRERLKQARERSEAAARYE